MEKLFLQLKGLNKRLNEVVEESLQGFASPETVAPFQFTPSASMLPSGFYVENVCFFIQKEESSFLAMISRFLRTEELSTLRLFSIFTPLPSQPKLQFGFLFFLAVVVCDVAASVIC